MLPLLSTGQGTHAKRQGFLPSLILVLLASVLPAQERSSATPTPATVVAETTAAQDQATEPANPAPEPDTFLLLGTGAVVLLLLFYTRRRARSLAPRTIAT